MSQVKIAYVGVGWIADWHWDAMKRCDTIEVVGACDAPDNFSKTQERCQAWGIKPYQSFEEILNDSSIDAVCIFSPTNFHTKQVLQAAKAGKHVLVEKPVALTVEDIDKFIEAEKEFGVTIAPAHNFVYRPVVTKAKEIIESGKLGTISYGSFRAVHFIPEEASNGWRKDFKSSGGGAMIDSGTHLIYQSLYLLGVPAKLSGFSANKHYTQIDAEDICQISVQYPDNTIGQIMQSWASNDGASCEIRIQGNKSNLCISDALYHDGEKIETDSEYPDSFYHLAKAFADAIINKTKMISGLNDAKNALIIAQKGYESADSEKLIQL